MDIKTNPASKVVYIQSKNGEAKMAVLPAHLQSNYDISNWIQQKMPDAQNWWSTTEPSSDAIRYDLIEFAEASGTTPENLQFTNGRTDKPNILHPEPGQTVILDTVQSRMFWIHSMPDGNYLLSCNHYLIGKNILITPALMTEEFSDLKTAWNIMQQIKCRPHTAYITITSKIPHRTLDPNIDIFDIQHPALEHIRYLEKQIAEIKPHLDAYKRTGWEPCDYSSFTYWKEKAEQMERENKTLMSRLVGALTEKERAQEQNATLIAMMNSNL